MRGASGANPRPEGVAGDERGGGELDSPRNGSEHARSLAKEAARSVRGGTAARATVATGGRRRLMLSWIKYDGANKPESLARKEFVDSLLTRAHTHTIPHTHTALDASHRSRVAARRRLSS
jgi:hypothetical protein